MRIKGDYTMKLKDLYKVGVNTVDFGNRQTPYIINGWVSNVTKGLINEIVAPGKIYSSLIYLLQLLQSKIVRTKLELQIIATHFNQ